MLEGLINDILHISECFIYYAIASNKFSIVSTEFEESRSIFKVGGFGQLIILILFKDQEILSFYLYMLKIVNTLLS